jgi:galactonate dehydratase
MRIVKIETFVADGGFRPLHFLKVTADQGLVGWSEFADGRPGLGGLGAVIAKLGGRLIGRDPRRCGQLVSDLYGSSRITYGGLHAQAIAAFENACLDIKAKALHVPVYELFGGALRDRIPVYWSQCGLFRVTQPELSSRFGLPPLRTLADVEALGAEVRERGFSALKTKLLRFGAKSGPTVHMPCFAPSGVGTALNTTPALLSDVQALVSAFRSGAGPGVEIIVDANFNFRAEGFIRLARALERLDIRWLEVDLLDAKTLATIRRSTRTPVGSLEVIHGRRPFLAYLEERAVDVAIVDVMWNGFTESLAMATLADAFETSIAPHNYTGLLAAVISAHLAAVIPNLTTMEFEVDRAPWQESFLTLTPEIEGGHLVLPTGPGWGCDVNEAALAQRAIVQ